MSEQDPPHEAARSSPGVPQSDNDRAIVDRLRARDAKAFAELIDRYHGSLVRLALAFVPSRAVAEEVVQETWLGVLDGIGSFEGHSSLKTWIFRILTNRARTRGERERRTVPFSALSNDDTDAVPAVDASRFKANGMWGVAPRRWEDDTPERLAMNQQAVGELETALAALPAGQRAVVTLRDLQGLDAAEVCNILEISETNQRVLLHRARSRLRAVLEAYLEGK